jgi:thiopeptide-type bacteriocin biosynthesis protein
LPIDLDNVCHVESFAQLVKGRDRSSLVERFVGDDEIVLQGPEGRFLHEVVVPFVRTGRVETAESPARHSILGGDAIPRTARRFSPGSEWLYVKFYTGTATADRVIRCVVAPIVRAALASGEARSWFFLRYGDPHWHVRFRLRGNPSALTSQVIPALWTAVGPLERDGSIWRIQLDTYEREVERYGGDDGIDLAEALFATDSDAVLQVLEDPGLPIDDRWRLGLHGMHAILMDLDLSFPQRLNVLRRARSALGAEHRTNVAFEKALGAKFRKERASIEALLAPSVAHGESLAAALAVFAERTAKNGPIIRELRAREQAGRLRVPIAELAGSFLHLHANRILRGEHRAQELVMYDFLSRLYESEQARGKR